MSTYSKKQGVSRDFFLSSSVSCMDAQRCTRTDRCTGGFIVSLLVTLWTTVFRFCRLVVLLLLSLFLRSVDHAKLNAAFRVGGLSAVLAEAETLYQFEKEMARNGGRDLLPPQRADQKTRLTVVLDLDETLVCAYNSALLPTDLEQIAMRGALSTFTMHCHGQETDFEGATRTAHVTVFERPGLSEFLDRASQFSELVLFTAGLEGYAKPVIDRIDPRGRISHRLYRSATVSTPIREHVKDLGLLGRDLSKCVLVDNNPFSFVLQPCNGIPCVPFTGRHPHDRQLIDVLLPLLEQLAGEEDIRPSLRDHYQMPAWFQNRGMLLHC